MIGDKDILSERYVSAGEGDLMKRVLRPPALALAVAVGLFCFPLALGAASQDRQASPDNKAVKQDNTAVNKGDRATDAQTAGQQSNDKSDVDMTRQIRRAIVSDKNLSTYAHNVKIITQHGQVTLKGPVRTEEEKTAVEAKAVGVAGAANVTNQISVAPRQTKASKQQ
jgi:hyperosmotically inducible periplasmic protein